MYVVTNIINSWDPTA